MEFPNNYIFFSSAYCSEAIPEQPIRATNVTTMPLDEPGQEITYTCDEGFEFVGGPVPVTLTTPTTTTSTTTTTTTTTTWMDWKDFKGAQYAKGEDCDCNWAEARVKCQDAGGDLATIHTWEVHKFIYDEWGDSFDAWIGLTDTETEGVYKWASGVQFEYNNWYPSCSAPQNDNMDCVRWESYVKGRWDHADCAQKESKYICQRGTSESMFWNSISGAEYAHFERKPCYNKDWDDSKTVCEDYGAILGLVLTQEAEDGIMTTFASGITDQFWIGIKKDSGSFKWINGNAIIWSDWGITQPDNNYHECVRYRYASSGGYWFWDDQSCSSSNTDGVLCMKGRPNTPTGWIYTQTYSTNSYERFSSSGVQSASSAGSSPKECCENCGALKDTTRNIAWGRGECMCFTSATPSTCISTGGSCKSDDYVSGGCVMVSGKKKRNVDIFNTITKSNAQNSKDFYQENHLLLSINKNVSYFHSRRKRSVDDSLVRQITCQGIWDNTAGYWSYQYEVPKYCFSKNQLTNIP